MTTLFQDTVCVRVFIHDSVVIVHGCIPRIVSHNQAASHIIYIHWGQPSPQYDVCCILHTDKRGRSAGYVRNQEAITTTLKLQFNLKLTLFLYLFEIWNKMFTCCDSWAVMSSGKFHWEPVHFFMIKKNRVSQIRVLFVFSGTVPRFQKKEIIFYLTYFVSTLEMPRYCIGHFEWRYLIIRNDSLRNLDENMSEFIVSTVAADGLCL